MFPESFTTARLEAERLTAAHEAEVQRMHRDAKTMAYLGGVRDAEFTKAYLEKNLLHWETFGFGVWILREVGGGEPIGRAVLRHLLVDDFDEVEVGYAFYPPYWGRGLATEVTRVCLEFAYDFLGFDTIVAAYPSAQLRVAARTAQVRARVRAGVHPPRRHVRVVPHGALQAGVDVTAPWRT